MRRVMCIWIPDWPLVRLARQRPELHGRTVVVYEASPQGGLKVVAATSALGCSLGGLETQTDTAADVTAGIYPGMPLAEAAAIIAHAQASVGNALGVRSPTELLEPHLEAADPDADRAALVQLAEWCQRFSPIVGIEDAPRPECLLLDITGFAHLFGGEPALAEEVVRAFGQRGLGVRVAIANTIGAAWAAVHSDLSHCLFPSGEALSALAPLPIGYLRVAEETVALLATLGIYRIGQLATLPRSALLARFGSELLWRLDQAAGHAPETILTRRVPPEYAADFTFEAPIANREAIEHVLAQLIARVTEPLARRREGVLRLACRLKYEGAFEENLKCAGRATFSLERKWATEKKQDTESNVIPFSLGLFRPSASPDYLCDLLRLRLESVRLAGPVTSVHVEVTAIGALELRQQALFEGEQNQDQPRRLAGLVDRLSNRLGRGAVVQVMLLPDAQPEYTCVDVPLAGNGAMNSSRKTRTASAPKKRGKKKLAHVSRYDLLSFAADERPTALLPQPAPIEVLAVGPDGTPARFCWAGRSYAIACAWGPERIETGWWRAGGQDASSSSKRRGHAFVRRDYYRIETTSGARFWIFRQLGDRQWFVHGTFD